MEILEEMEKAIEDQRKKENIICPYCELAQDQEIRNEYVTYWGEDGEQTCDCGHCERTFLVKEKVTRTFETRIIEEAKDETDR